MNTKHSNTEGECWRAHIPRLGDTCDQEYYLSAGGPLLGNRERAERGRSRIIEWIAELEVLKGQSTCVACLQEIEMQIELQRRAVLEIEAAWSVTRPLQDPQ